MRVRVRGAMGDGAHDAVMADRAEMTAAIKENLAVIAQRHLAFKGLLTLKNYQKMRENFAPPRAQRARRGRQRSVCLLVKGARRAAAPHVRSFVEGCVGWARRG